MEGGAVLAELTHQRPATNLNKAVRMYICAKVMVCDANVAVSKRGCAGSLFEECSCVAVHPWHRAMYRVSFCLQCCIFFMRKAL